MDFAAALRDLGLDPLCDEPLARHGYWRIGGPADVLVDVPSLEVLAAVQALGAPVTVLGRGSNLLVSDDGVEGIVVRLTGALKDVTIDGDVLHAGGGAPNTVVLGRLKRARRTGLACLAGVPGTIGGAVRMNAGTRLGETVDHLQSVTLVRVGGDIVEVDAKALHFGYRRADLPQGAIVAAARFAVGTDGFDEEQAAIAAHMDARRRTQPLDQPSCGSVFKNPPGDHAGRLVEAVGLKGTQIGGARISEVHANFIVNTGGATAADVEALIARATDEVQRRFAVELACEVHRVGRATPHGRLR